MRLRDLKHRQLASTRHHVWVWAPDHFDSNNWHGGWDDDDDADEPVCPLCAGDGMDPMTDYALECPECEGEGR